METENDLALSAELQIASAATPARCRDALVKKGRLRAVSKPNGQLYRVGLRSFLVSNQSKTLIMQTVQAN
jgi:hypothetical protein